MENVFFALSLIALVAFVVGMFNPNIVKCATRGKTALIFMSAFIVFLIISAALTPDVEKKIDTQENTQSEEVLTAESDVENEAKQDADGVIEQQTVSVGDFSYTVAKVSYKKRVGSRLSLFGRKKADGVFLVMCLRITNMGKETKMLGSELFAVSNKTGMYKPSTEAEVLLDLNGKKTMTGFKQCQPGITTDVILVFEVPCKDEYYLHLPGGDIKDDVEGSVISTKILLRK